MLPRSLATSFAFSLVPIKLVKSARDAVRGGRARNVSAYVAEALADKVMLDDLSALLQQMLADRWPFNKDRAPVCGQDPEWFENQQPVTGATLDSGALVAFERSKRQVVALVARALERKDVLALPAGVIAQVWRDGARQVRLVRLLASNLVEIVVLDDPTARAVGQLCGVTSTADVVDASVVCCARQRGHAILTSDPDDIRRIDPRIEVLAV